MVRLHRADRARSVVRRAYRLAAWCALPAPRAASFAPTSGEREREAFARAVRTREDALDRTLFARQVGEPEYFAEADGAASLRAAFGVRAMSFDAPWLLDCRCSWNGNRAHAAYINAPFHGQTRRPCGIRTLPFLQRALAATNLDYCGPARCMDRRPLRSRRSALRVRICKLPVAGRDGSVFICIDTSGSMASTDVSPTRAGAAQNAARAFIQQAPAGIKIGLITFSGDGRADRAAQRKQRNDDRRARSDSGAQRRNRDRGRAATGRDHSSRRAVIASVVLITDGVNNTGVDPQEMAQYFGAHHVPIYTIGIGTPNGDVIGGETVDDR